MMKKDLCTYFLRGYCKNGQNCEFSHNIPNSKFHPNTQFHPNPQFHPNSQYHPNPQNHPKAEPAETQCKYFLKNSCKKPGCSYFHGYCKRLKYIKTISNHKNEINQLLAMDNIKYISSDNKVFYIRKSGNDEVYEEKVPEGYNIRKMIYSSNKVICAIQNEQS